METEKRKQKRTATTKPQRKDGTNTGLVFLLALVALYVLTMPFTKVEESFNLQAIHDLLYHGTDLEAYDHQQFPGVVPRTFTGACLVALLSYPILRAGAMLGLRKAYSLYIVRMVIAVLSVGAMGRFQKAVSRRFGTEVGNVLLGITCMQFHLPFYLSRPLPNVFAMMLTNYAMGIWVEGGNAAKVVYLLAFATTVVRCDAILLAGPIGLQLYFNGELTLAQGIKSGTLATLGGVVFSIILDSCFWGRLLYPEGVVLFFNTFQNKSVEWGTSPWHWYITSALPRALLGAFPLAVLGILLEKKLVKVMTPCIAFIALYSFLPHKELRFIFFALPLLNLSAACAVVHIFQKKAGTFWGLAKVGSLCAGIASLFCTIMFACAAYHNYPGGVGFRWLHQQNTSTVEPARVHIDTFTAMSGVSRFGEEREGWIYSKVEGLNHTMYLSMGYSYVISEEQEIPDFRMLHAVDGFDGIGLRKGFPPFEWRVMPKVFVHERIT